MRFLCLVILIVLSTVNRLKADGAYYQYSTLAREAYDKAIRLRLQEARVLVARMKRQEPGNLIAVHIEDYIDFFTAFISENAQTHEALKPARDRRLEALKAGETRSPWHLYVEADMRLHWALLKFRFGEYLGGFTEVNKAAKLLERNRRNFPGFYPNQKDLGILHAAVGTVPDQYKWGLELLTSLNGTIEQGRSELESVILYAQRNDFVFKDETVGLYALLLLHLDNRSDEAWQTVSAAHWKPDEHPLQCFVMAHIAMRTGRNDKAVELLNNRPQGKAFFSFPFMHYMVGLAKLRRLDTDASPHFQRFLSQFKGRHYIKEAYQKMAWSELLNNNVEGYKRQMRVCLQKGRQESGGDKNAQREAELGLTPHITLLKARLLFDGGYFKKALDLLQSKKDSDFAEKRHRLEYHYRLGRVLHGLKRYEDALSAYKQTIAEGRNERYFFACNAALQMGLVYEALKDKNNAQAAFNLCLGMSPEEYKASLHQQAKAGLGRLR